MKQIRRLDSAPTQDPYAKGQRGLLRTLSLSEATFRALERKRPGLIIVQGNSVLVGHPFGGAIAVQYAYTNRDAFAKEFSPMFERLAPACKQKEAPLGFRLTVLDRSSRPYLEPVLRAQAFELSREWMRMNLPELPDSGPPDDAIAQGFALRHAEVGDTESIVELDAVAFPSPALSSEVVRDMISQEAERDMTSEAAVLRVLEDSESGRTVGFLRLRVEGPGTGYVSDVAVHPDFQGRGLGEAMMRWALAWFRAEGLRRAALTVSAGNSPAIQLYRKLGFTAGDMGFDYRRPIDEDEVRQLLDKRRGSLIRLGRWR